MKRSLNLISGILMTALAAAVMSGCAHDDETAAVKGSANSVTDAVDFLITGVDGAALENVQAALESLPAISKKRAFIFRREIRDKTAQSLRALGYYHPSISIETPRRDDESSTVKVTIDPGKPLFIRACNIEILGEGADYSSFARLIAASGLKSYTVVNHGAYESLKEDLKNNALSLGFFDYRLLSSQIVVYEDENHADIELAADTGRRYRFGPVIADDTTRELMKPSRTLMTVNEGVPFSSETLKNYQTSMSRTGFYSSVDVRPALEQKTDDEVPLEIKLERKKHNLMRTGIGYSTDEKVRLMLGWDKPLLNEDGHSLSTYARVSNVKQNAEAVYKIPRKDPNLDYYYVRLAQIHTDFNDTKSDLSHLSLHYVADMTGKWRRDYSIRAEYEDYTQGSESGNAINVMPGLMLSRREHSGGYDPRYGYDITGDFTGASSLWSDHSFFRGLVSFRGIMSPTADTRFVFRLTGGALWGADSLNVPPSLRFFAGGDRSIRGFDYLSKAPRNSGGLKGGRYLATGTAEFQFPIGIDSSRMAVFLDAGKAFDKFSASDMLYGPGIGYRYLSKYGTASVDLAVGISDDDHGVKLHFSFGPEF